MLHGLGVVYRLDWVWQSGPSLVFFLQVADERVDAARVDLVLRRIELAVIQVGNEALLSLS